MNRRDEDVKSIEQALERGYFLIQSTDPLVYISIGGFVVVVRPDGTMGRYNLVERS